MRTAQPLLIAIPCLLLGTGCLRLTDDRLGTEPATAVQALAADVQAPAAAPEPTIQPVVAMVQDPLTHELSNDRNDTVRLAIERSLPYLEEYGVAWIETHGCSSCHQVPVMFWSHHAAADRGLAVDKVKLDEWTRFVLDESKTAGVLNADGIAQMILGRPQALPPAQASELEALAEIVAAGQQDDGSWQAGGQLPQQRRPVSETHRVSTAWATLALASYDDSTETVAAARRQLDEWLQDTSGGESLEWLAVRLLYAHRFGDPQRTAELRQALLAQQNADGGWGWLRGGTSDAFATGQSLYTLQQLPRQDDAAAIERARTFLLDNQQDDGSWSVRSTLRQEHGPTPTGIYWGTGWATIGLLSTLPVESSALPAVATDRVAALPH
ncbi:MAG: prenyltransferase/squalene oxidase repeat-containing protein [Acidobacteriota bacterium]